MLESFFKVSSLKYALGLSLLSFSLHVSAQNSPQISPQSSATSFEQAQDLTDPSQTTSDPTSQDSSNSAGATRVTGLELGNNLTHVTLKGHVRMQCADYLLATASDYDCTMDTLEPFTSSRFQTATSIDADHFDLRVQHEKSWARSKSGDYLPSSATSALSLNLWTSNIFDWPILNDGVNLATYQLTKAGKVVATGNFTVNVAHISRTCTTATLTSYDPGDCKKKSYACDRYFFENKHCLVH